MRRDSTLDHDPNGDFDIRGSLICDGDFPGFWWLNFPVVGPTSVLQICASTLFGGVQAFANAYCGWFEGEVFFSIFSIRIRNIHLLNYPTYSR